MKVSTLFGGLLAGIATAAPLVARQDTNIDTTVLQFALTLEHLENFFYKDALTKYSQADFAAAGFDATFYNNLKYVASDEESHVRVLSASLQTAGVTPNAACTYKFPYTDVSSFVTLASVIEGVGTSAYLGAAPLITSKDYLTAAGSILVTEALHTSYERASIGEVPFPTPYGTPLDPTSVYSIASAFIVSCPASNAALPFTAYPALTYDAPTSKSKREWDNWNPDANNQGGPKTDIRGSDGSNWESQSCPGYGGSGHTVGPSAPAAPLPQAGSTAKFTATKAVPAGSYLTFVSGLTVTSVPATVSGNDASGAIPATVGGQTYVFLTSADVEGKLDASKIIAGPSVVEIAPIPQSIDYSYIKN